jgi:hypothetical protein
MLILQQRVRERDIRNGNTFANATLKIKGKRSNKTIFANLS